MTFTFTQRPTPMMYFLHSHKPIALDIRRAKMRGFSLIEMAVVLFIITLLLGGLLPTISSQIEQQRRNDTQKLLTDIRESLLGYVTVNGRLPSPACGSVTSDSTYAGLELVPASAASSTYCPTPDEVTVLPWVTLGVKETDAWGNRFSYQVTTKYASTLISGTQTAFLMNDTGDITIRSIAGSLTSASAPVIVLSHGAKGCGAYLPTGARVNDTPATTPPIYCNDVSQQENADIDKNIVSNTNTSAFDDIVVWISSVSIINRMVTVAKLP